MMANATRAVVTALSTHDATIGNLSKIDHIIVLMMENRSFDHLMGYLKLNNVLDVDGLIPGMSNSYQGKTYPIRQLANTAFEPGQDPCHTESCVAEQLSGGNAGFVSSYARSHAGDPDPGLVMGYYDGSALPVYDRLSKSFCLCDRWFCSVDGATWPNRLYSLTGGAGGSKDNKSIPIYNLRSFVRHLDSRKATWNWYAHDVSTLRLVDAHYRIGRYDRFRFFAHKTRDNFLKDASDGTLPSVSWIDPDFSDLGFSGNDDHPPSDLKRGQELVLKTVTAVMQSPQWQRSMLVIVYDEHGGLFDHVAPGTAADDSARFRRYGCRVPAIIVSPWVEAGVPVHEVFDHTSLIKTILLRFCSDAEGQIPDMGQRVGAANHLGRLLTGTAPLTPIDVADLRETVANWQAELFHATFNATVVSTRALRESPNEFQVGIERARKKLHDQGLPVGQL